MKRSIHRILSSLIGFSLIVCAVGCNGSQSGTTQSESETTTAKPVITAATDVTAEAVTATEGTSMKVENQGFKYRPGDIIEFGKYEQDNKESNGKEDIEWIVLAREGNKVLVLSRYALACKPYNNKKADVTWETCSLRKWLNEDFFESAFDEEDKSCIVKTNVTADKNPEYETSQGNPTTDNVFLLSIAEFNKYFTSTKNVSCDGTLFCQAQDKETNATTFVWWLRTTGFSPKHALCITYYCGDTPVSNYGIFVDRVKGCTSMEELGNSGVRPAMWLELPDYYTTPHKHLNAWVEGYGTVRLNCEASTGKEVRAEIPDMPCQILYTDGFPSYGGEVRYTNETEKAIVEWLDKNVGKDLGYGWYDGNRYGSSVLYYTGHLRIQDDQ